MKYLLLLTAFALLGSFGIAQSSKLLSENEATSTIQVTTPQEPSSCNSSGCTVGDDHTKNLSFSDIKKLINTLNNEKYDENSTTLDTLLFHHEKVHQYINTQGNWTIDKRWSDTLNKEIPKKEFMLFIKVTDERGHEHLTLTEKVKLSHAYHLHHSDIIKNEELMISGRSKRVGLHHIWSRF